MKKGVCVLSFSAIVNALFYTKYSRQKSNFQKAQGLPLTLTKSPPKFYMHAAASLICALCNIQ